ncbi:hypothetical protein [Parafrankia discariae]|uniref:hypothetical protein n=1 Tax=Parafrankia discariae TaxID=365528 RepID=UPI0003A85654|nr:hypothetical protein [Parafrankia discariae]
MASESDEAQREESFVVRLLLDCDGVRSTSVQHARENAPMRWPGWEPSEVIAFIAARAGRLAPTAPAGALEPLSGSRPLSGSEPLPVRLGVQVEPAGPHPGEPLTVALSIGFTPAHPPPTGPLEYHAVVGVRPGDAAPGAAGSAGHGTGPGGTVLRARGRLSTRSTVIRLTGPGLPTGRHLIDAAVSLRVAGVGRPVGLATATQVVLEVTDRRGSTPLPAPSGTSPTKPATKPVSNTDTDARRPGGA